MPRGMVYSETIEPKYLDRLKRLRLPSRQFDSNKNVLMFLYGDGDNAPKNFNLQVYKMKDGSLKMVTTSKHVLEDLLSETETRE